MAKSIIPKYRRQRRKSGDLAFVEFDGRRIYLGVYGSDSSKQLYFQVLAEYHVSGVVSKGNNYEFTII